MHKKICFVANQGQHYRFPIFRKMGEELDCEFYLGDKLKTPIKPFDYKSLKGYQKTLKNIYIGNFYWQSGAVRLFWKHYDSYIFTGEPFCLSTWVFLILSLFSRKQTIAWTHGWYGREGRLKTIIKKAYFSLFTDIWVYGEHGIALMEKEGISKRKMRCIANSLDTYQNLEIRRTLCEQPIYYEHFGNHNPVIIYCGRLQQVKKIDMIIDSLKILKERGTPANLIIIGKDVDGLKLEDYAAAQGVAEMVWFYGPCYDNRLLGSFFYNAHVCVSPGNIGLTAIHALSFGCPAITHDNFAHQMPEFEAIQPGTTGDFFKEGNIKDLTDKILKWTQKTADQRRKAREAAFAEIDRKWNVDYQMQVIKETLSAQQQ